MQISNCLYLLRLADKSARRYGPSRGLAGVGRRMTDSEDHRLCRLRRGKPFGSLEVSDEALRLVLVLVLHRDRSSRPVLAHLTVTAAIIHQPSFSRARVPPEVDRAEKFPPGGWRRGLSGIAGGTVVTRLPCGPSHSARCQQFLCIT